MDRERVQLAEVANHYAAKAARLEAVLEMVLKAACYGCAQGTAEHWHICIEARRMLAD